MNLRSLLVRTRKALQGPRSLKGAAISKSMTNGKTQKKLQQMMRGISTAKSAQDYLQKSAQSNVVLFGRDHERATANKGKESQSHHYNNFFRRFIVRPDRPFRRRWDTLQMLCMVYISVVVPFRVGLTVYAEGGWYILELAIDAYFYLDLVLNFFTGHQYPDGTLMMEPKLVAQAYLQSWFTLDFVSCLPVDFILRLVQGTLLCSLQNTCKVHTNSAGMLFRLLKVLRLFKLIKLVRLFSIRRLIDRYQHDLFLVLPFLSVAQMFVVILFLGHLYGCFFYYFSTTEWRTDAERHEIELTLANGQISTGRKLTPWLISEFGGEYGQPGTAGLASRYIGSMYWAFATLCTVGYGDISAKTEAERIVAIVSMITGGFIFSGVIAKIGSLVAKLDAAKSAHQEKMDAVTAFIRENKMPRDLRSQVLIFFTKQQFRSYNLRTILSQLPYDLRSSILLYLYRDIIKKVPFFDGADDIFITDVCLRLKPAAHTAGTYIYTAGEIGRELLVLVKGEVEVVGPHKQVTRVLYEGSYFGEGSVLGDVRRMESVRARMACSLCALEAEDLEELLVNYPEMDAMLRKVYQRRKEHFQSSNRLDAALAGVPRRVSRRFTTSAAPGAPKSVGVLKVRRNLSLSAKPPVESGEDSIGETEASVEGVSSPEGDFLPSASLNRGLSESLGFGSPPLESENSPTASDGEASNRGGTCEGKRNRNKGAFHNRVFPEPSNRLGADSDAEKQSDGPKKVPGEAKELMSIAGILIKPKIPTLDGPLSIEGQPNVHMKPRDKPRLVTTSVADSESEVGEVGPLDRTSDGGHLPTVAVPTKSSSPTAVGDLQGLERRDNEVAGAHGLVGLRAEMRTLRHEVKTLRTEHRRDVAILQEQHKTMMSLLMKICRQTEPDPDSKSHYFRNV